MLFDAMEIRADVASIKTVNAVMYSPYKHNFTLEWLTGCCSIGALSGDIIGAGHGGSISDQVATTVSQILKSVLFGMGFKINKGFLIENKCAFLGII